MDQHTTPQVRATIALTPATIGCLVLIGSFFLPWIGIIGQSVSGMQLNQIWDPGKFVWTIPAAAAVAAVLGLAGRPNLALCQIAGGIPFIFLALALYQTGSDVFKALLIGGYLTLISGLFLLCVAPRLGRARRKGTT